MKIKDLLMLPSREAIMQERLQEGIELRKKQLEIEEMKEKKMKEKKMKEKALFIKMIEQKGLSEEDTKAFLVQLLEFTTLVKKMREAQIKWDEDESRSAIELWAIAKVKGDLEIEVDQWLKTML